MRSKGPLGEDWRLGVQVIGNAKGNSAPTGGGMHVEGRGSDSR